MLAIVGLGNPGEKYAHTRHNAGWDVLEILSQKLNAPIKRLKCQATIGDAMIGSEKVLLVHPQTFMNLSGSAVQEMMAFYKLAPEQVLVAVDDIDLPFGQVRVRAKGGPGTHNGMRSIVQCTGTDAFPRIRIGMGAPPPEWDLADWVLGGFNTPEDRKIAFDAYMLASDAALCWAENGINLAMNRFNKKPVTDTAK